MIDATLADADRAPSALRRPVHARGADGRPRRARPPPGRTRWPTRRSPASSSGCCGSTPARPACSTTPPGSPSVAGARILLKREDLNHTGAHKIRNVLGQALLTKRMGKTRVIAETGAGQHGVAAATAAAYLGLDCVVYMGEVDTERQALNVARMQLLGAEVVAGDHRLAHPQGRHQRGDARLGRQRRPHGLPLRHRGRAAPVPVAWSAPSCRGIGDEARAQCLELTGALPDAVTACVGGGSNAIGLFAAFVDDADVRIVGFEAGRRRRRRPRGTPRRSAPATSASCTAPAPTCCRTRTARPSSRTRSPRGSTTPASAPSTPTSPSPDARRTVPVTDAAGDGRLRAARPHRGDHPRHRVRARGRRHLAAGQGDARRDDPGQPLRAAATRTWAPPWSGSAWATRPPKMSRSSRSHGGLRDARGPRGAAALVGYLPAGFPVRGGAASRRCR